MKLPPSKDIAFVIIQLVLFVLYFTPVVHLTFRIPALLQFTGLIIAIIGCLIIPTAVLQLNRNITPFPTPKETGTLIQSGLYKYIRHPVYSGIFLAALGYGLSQGSLWKLSIGIILLVLFFFKSKYEETLLLAHFPQYGEYRKKTYRFFPFF